MSARTPAQCAAWDMFQLNAFEQRVRLFTRTLSPTRRAEVAARSRFRNQPYLRRADEPDPDDAIPGLTSGPNPSFP